MMRRRSAVLVGCAVVAAGLRPAAARSLVDVGPPGKHFKLTAQAHVAAETFKSGRPVVGTSYFYWYDVYTGAHLRNPDGTDALTNHPPEQAMADLSYRSAAWHYGQLRDVRQAGIDFIMPVFWGFPGDYQGWSFVGLPPLVEAHDRMLAEHDRDPSNPLPPKIGMFYDTSTLKHNAGLGPKSLHVDLTTPDGHDWFYVTIRDFFSMVPPEKWARIDGRPIVFLYAASFAAKVDDTILEDTRRRFRADFGTDFFLVRHADWPGQADAWYQWGGATGLTLGDCVAGIGPGYDDSAVPGRGPLVVPRRNGRFYEEQWERLLKLQSSRRPWIAHVETWNEWHEGTDVARSQAWGTQYMALTARYADQFRAGVRLPLAGPYVHAERVRWAGQVVGGLQLLPSRGDGCWEAQLIDGSHAVVTIPGPESHAGRYLYFDVDDSYLYDEVDRVVELTAAFRDDGKCTRFRVEYDNNDPQAGVVLGAFRPSGWVNVGNTGTWRTVKLQLPDVRFTNRAHSADFRLIADGADRRLTIREVLVRKLPGTLTRPASAPASTGGTSE